MEKETVLSMPVSLNYYLKNGTDVQFVKEKLRQDRKMSKIILEKIIDGLQKPTWQISQADCVDKFVIEPDKRIFSCVYSDVCAAKEKDCASCRERIEANAALFATQLFEKLKADYKKQIEQEIRGKLEDRMRVELGTNSPHLDNWWQAFWFEVWHQVQHPGNDRSISYDDWVETIPIDMEEKHEEDNTSN